MVDRKISNAYSIDSGLGPLTIIVVLDENSYPCDVFGKLVSDDVGSVGLIEWGCRLIGLLLQQGTEMWEIIEACQGVEEIGNDLALILREYDNE